MVNGTNQPYDYSIFAGVDIPEGSIPVGGKPHLDPGPYRAALTKFRDYINEKSNRTIQIDMTVVGGAEDGITITEYFSMMPNRTGKPSRGVMAAGQFFRAMGIKDPGKMGQVPQEIIEQKLYSRQCTIVLRDEDEPARPMIDPDTQEQAVDEYGNPRFWEARTISRIDHFESIERATANPNGSVAAPAATPPPAAQLEEPEPAQAVQAPPPPRQAPKPKQPAVAAAATADENDDLFG